MPDDRVRTPTVTFLVVGAGKAGTTWLYEVLAAHPQVAMARAKETMFFDENYDRGLDWYHSLLPCHAGARAVGEVSNSYFAATVVPERIAAYNADMGLVAMLRDPIERAFSNYLFFLRNDQCRGSFEDVLTQRPDILEHGFYGRNLAHYQQFFPAEQIRLVGYDDLERDSHEVAAGVLRFIGVDDRQVPEIAGERVLVASAARSRLLARMAKTSAIAVRRAGGPGVVTAVKRSRASSLLYRPLQDRPTMEPTTRSRLRNLYAGDVELLSALTGVDWANRWWGI